MLPYNNEDIRWEGKEEKQEEKPALCFVGRRPCNYTSKFLVTPQSDQSGAPLE